MNSWLLQAEGSFPVEYRVELGDRLYGCDDCLDACPPGHRLMEASRSRLHKVGHKLSFFSSLKDFYDGYVELLLDT